MTYKKSTGERIFDTGNYIILGLISMICIYPLLYVLFASISDPHRLTAHNGILLYPLGVTFEGYKLVFKNPNIITSYLNTIFYVLVGTTLNVSLTALSAYVLSKKRLYFRKALTILVVITMFFDGGIIPFYLVVNKLGLYDTRLALILPSLITVWNMMVMRTAFASIPPSLEESAKMDGANDFQIFYKISLPLTKATVAVITLFYAVYHWNSWYHASIFLRDRGLYPLQLILREILIQNDTTTMTAGADIVDESTEELYRNLVQYSTIMVATLPIICIYPFIQKYFVKGVMIGSVKG